MFICLMATAGIKLYEPAMTNDGVYLIADNVRIDNSSLLSRRNDICLIRNMREDTKKRDDP